MTLHLDLLRHGETEIGGFRGSLDDALTERGWAQLHAAVADRSGWDRIVSSPLQRCARFAQVLAEQRTLPLSFEADLQELHFGAWEGRSAAQLMETEEASLGLFWSDPYAFTPPEGESLTHFSARVHRALGRLHADYPGQRLLLVVHGGVMRLLLAEARGLPREHLLQVEVGHGALFQVRMAADGALSEPA